MKINSFSVFISTSIFIHGIIITGLFFIHSVQTQTQSDFDVEFITPFEKTGPAASAENNLQKTDFKNVSKPFRAKEQLKDTYQEAVPDLAMKSGLESDQGKGFTQLDSEQGQADLSGPEILGQKSLATSYLGRIKSKIENQKLYPKASKVFKEQGLVKIRMILQRNGQILKIEIAESSQIQRLDEAALKSVAAASPFEPFPGDIQYRTWNLVVPIRYSLN